MDRYRLKNIIILILSLMNVFLLASLAIREGARQSAKETAVEQMVSLFAADGITLDPDVISDETPPASRSLTRSTDLERRAATLLLGTASPLPTREAESPHTAVTEARLNFVPAAALTPAAHSARRILPTSARISAGNSAIPSPSFNWIQTPPVPARPSFCAMDCLCITAPSLSPLRKGS